MKAAALAIALYAFTGTTAEPQVRVVRLGTEVIPVAIADLASKATALLQSCSVDSTSYAASALGWEAALAAESLVHVQFPIPQQLELAETSLAVNEILVPLPSGRWPAHLFVVVRACSCGAPIARLASMPVG